MMSVLRLVGRLRLQRIAGVETYVVCLTDGQAATNRGDASSADALGKMRRDEFSASCKVLGVSHHELLDYQDGQLEFVNFSVAAERLVERIRRYKPDVVITFGGDGGPNTHPDHMMVSMLTTAAFHWAGQAKRYRDAGAPFKTHGCTTLLQISICQTEHLLCRCRGLRHLISVR